MNFLKKMSSLVDPLQDSIDEQYEQMLSELGILMNKEQIESTSSKQRLVVMFFEHLSFPKENTIIP